MPQKKPGPSVLASCGTGCLGLVVVIVAFVLLTNSALSLFNSANAHVAPATWTYPASSQGKVVIFASTPDGTPSPSDVTITGPSGTTVALGPYSGGTTSLSTSSGSYVPIGQAVLPSAGTYTVKASGPAGDDFFLFGAGSLGNSGLILAMIGLGVLIAIAGIVLLIVGMVRRSGAKSAPQVLPMTVGGSVMPPPPAPPAGPPMTFGSPPAASPPPTPPMPPSPPGFGTPPSFPPPPTFGTPPQAPPAQGPPPGSSPPPPGPPPQPPAAP